MEEQAGNKLTDQIPDFKYFKKFKVFQNFQKNSKFSHLKLNIKNKQKKHFKVVVASLPLENLHPVKKKLKF